MDPKLLILRNALPENTVDNIVRGVQRYDYHADVYDNPLERKLQIPKTHHQLWYYADLFYQLRHPLILAFLSKYFDTQLYNPQSNYFDGIFLYREGDYLEEHLDTIHHEGETKALILNVYFTRCKGGNLIINKYVVEPEPGMIVAFLNDDQSWHKVTQITEGQRIMATLGYASNEFQTERTNERAFFIAHSQQQLEEIVRRGQPITLS